ncbi:PREDICTED: tubulin-folding cofactor B [Ceratosolen solmsi marchali]|uniref:Tubulin-folding cofactor B n=1 Tax=Ceratosolen solmsi marchali TaxID=326594 RepID=A0AAJ6YEN9_9HYME|nr:PREDICTED: tubulin-folding cofactor B [Ceratosolen solmsi marchali]
MSSFDTSSTDFVNVTITSSNNEDYSVERRFKRNITIEEFKNKLELLIGCRSNAMNLEVYNKNDDIVCKPNDISNYLGSYPIDNGMRVHVTANDKEEIQDPSTVQKFELSDDTYAKMPSTVKAFLKENKLGKYDEDKVRKMEENRVLELENDKKLISCMKVNDRCEVTIPGNPKRKATIMYVGQTEFKPGYWVGVKYDEPLGKNNGSVAGVQYFDCYDKYGGFVKPSCIVLGDFPEDDYDLNEL